MFSKQGAKDKPTLSGVVYKIITPEGTYVPYSGIYHLNQEQSQILRKYIKENLQNGCIQHSQSPAGAPTLFIIKPDGTRRLCVGY